MENNEMIDMLGKSSVKGREDSSLFDLSKLMFCDIPSFLDTTPDEELVDEDIINNFDKLLEELSDTSDIQDFVDEILGKKKDTDQGGDGIDTDIDQGGEGDGTDGGKSDKDTDDRDETDEDTDQGGDGIDDEDDEHEKETQKKDDKDSKSNGQPCKSVIIEFAADTVKYTHEPFVWNVVPGQQIDSSTIIAYCKQKNKILPVRSIFSKGTVRKDPEDGGFWRCWKTVTSRHIVIDCPEKDKKNSGSSSFDIEKLFNNSYMMIEMAQKLQHAGDVFNIVTNHYIYVTYCHLLYYFGIPRHWDRLIDIIPAPLDDEGNVLGEDTVITSYVYEDVAEDDKPEVVFANFINNVYRPRVERYREEIQKIISTDSLKASKGNPSKMKKIAQSAVDLNNEFFDDIVYMYRNCHKWFKTVKIDMDKDEFCIKSWRFLQRMEFEFENMNDDNFKIYKEKVYDEFVKELGKGHLDYKDKVSDKRDGRYVDYHEYYDNYIGRIWNSLDSSSYYDYNDWDKEYDGDEWDSSIYDSSLNLYSTNYIIKEYISAYDDHSRDYETYFDNLTRRGLETDTQREVLGDCDLHENHEFLSENKSFEEYLEESHATDGYVARIKTKKVWAAEPEETISDYFNHITKEIFNNERYFTVKYKSLLHYFSETHPHYGDQRWKIAEEVRRFDELLDCMVSVYKAFSVSNITGSKKMKDYFKAFLMENFKEEAEWPEPSEYFYDYNSEFFYEHYVFLNIDEIKGECTAEKAEPYLNQGTAIGDEAQINDYVDGINTYTGYIPVEYSDYDNYSGSPEDVEYMDEGDLDNPIFGSNMMNPPKLIEDLTDTANALAQQGLDMGVYNGPDRITDDSVDNGNSEDNGNGGDGNGIDNGGSNGGNGDNGGDDSDGDGASPNDNGNGNPSNTDDNVGDNGDGKNPAIIDVEKEVSVDLTQYKYWLKYFGLATLGTMMFLGCGIPLPCMACIPLPCIYIPILVIALNKVGMIIVIGIVIRGAYVGPIMLFVNLKSSENSMLIPVTMSLATLKDMMQDKIDSISDMAKMAASAKTIPVKATLTAELKMKKEYEAKVKALKEINVEGKESIIDNFKKAAGEDLKQIVTRLKTEVDEKTDEVKSTVSDTVSNVEDGVSSITSVGSGNQTKTADDNEKVSGSIK